MGRKRTPRAVFDYVDGAAEAEISMRRSRKVFEEIEFHPSVLRDVAAVDTSTTVLGGPSALPFGLAPTGFTRMMHHAGEPAVAKAAGDAGIVFALSTLGTTSARDLAIAAPDTNRWFQLYLPKDRGIASELVAGAVESGSSALVVTVDTVVPGIRLRDARNGLSFPPALTLRTLGGMAVHPKWWYRMLTGDPLNFSSLQGFEGSLPEILAQIWDPSLSLADLEWVRGRWDGPLVIKGIQRVDDVGFAFDIGADAVILSNHGGRQLDRSVVPLRILKEAVETHGERGEIYIDGGITNGADVVACVALGAKLCFVGRAYLYGLMAGGQAGVERAIEILTEDVVRTMRLLGAASVSDLRPDMVTFIP
jgi:L-lactate dehydrogenase (cytochrome)